MNRVTSRSSIAYAWNVFLLTASPAVRVIHHRYGAWCRKIVRKGGPGNNFPTPLLSNETTDVHGTKYVCAHGTVVENNFIFIFIKHDFSFKA